MKIVVGHFWDLKGLMDKGVLRSETATAYYSIQLLVDFLRQSELKIHVSY